MSDFTCYTGDTLKLRLKIYENKNRRVVKDITGLTLMFRAADRLISPLVEVEKSTGSGIVSADPTTGEAVITISADDTDGFDEQGGVLPFYVRLVDGVDVYTISTGRIIIKRLPA